IAYILSDNLSLNLNTDNTADKSLSLKSDTWSLREASPQAGGEAISKSGIASPPKADRNDNSVTIPGKFGYSYIDTVRSSLPLADTHTLETTILVLENNASRTDIEESLLQVTKLVIEDSAYLDRDTLNEFAEAVEIIRTIDRMKGAMKEADFQAISKGLVKLVEEQHSTYNDYLKTTKDLYEKLQFLLGLLIEDESLPEAYTPLYSVSVLAKKKIAVDLALERLKAKDEASLTINQKEALRIDKETLRPLREEYLSKLKLFITDFVWDMKEVIKDKGPASISKDEFNFRALLFLNNEEFAANAASR
ncbi:MAG: hypothetical protein WC658_05400, partial [Candidatus Omnitrophota bacterium]